MSVSLFCHIIIPDLISDMIHKIASSEGRQQQHLALTASHPPLSRSWPRSDSLCVSSSERLTAPATPLVPCTPRGWSLARASEPTLKVPHLMPRLTARLCRRRLNGPGHPSVASVAITARPGLCSIVSVAVESLAQHSEELSLLTPVTSHISHLGRDPSLRQQSTPQSSSGHSAVIIS